MGDPTPLKDLMVNDRYWLGRARGMLDQSIRGRDEAAGRLAAALGWLWTVYTGGALVGVALREQPLPDWAVGVIVSPALLLVVAYGLAMWAVLPVEVAFDPRVVQEIQQVHVHATQVKQSRLRLAGVAAGLGAAAVIAAIITTSTVQGGPRGPTLTATVHRQAAGRGVVLVEGQFSSGKPVTLTVTGDRSRSELAAQLSVADTAGIVHTTIPVSSTGPYQVQATWSDGTQRWTLITQAIDITPASP